MRNTAALFLLIAIFSSCSIDKEDSKPVFTNTLDHYVNQFNNLERDILIACAASEPESNSDFGVSVFFFPFHGAQDYRYYESAGTDINPDEFSKYTYRDWETFPVFNGYLRRFLYPVSNEEKWIVLTYLTDGKLHVCDPIQLKQIARPTLYGHDKVEIDFSTPTEPLFSWEADEDAENIIYFQVVSDSAGNLISGTYTYDKHWQFYDLSNVVLNIKEQDPPQILHPGRTYRFTLMGVSEDNWVNLVGEKEFVTE